MNKLLEELDECLQKSDKAMSQKKTVLLHI